MAEFYKGNVKSYCNKCEAITTFEFKNSNGEYGTIVNEQGGIGNTSRTIFKLLRCAGCGSGGLAELFYNSSNRQYFEGSLQNFWPQAFPLINMPQNIPADIENELKEAALCAAHGAYRAGSAMLRSVLEKILKLNGYNKGDLKFKINEAFNDGIITASKVQRAHDDIRVLGNDILHDTWRSVDEDEFNTAMYYATRIMEEFYGDRQTVEKVLKSKGRI